MDLRIFIERLMAWTFMLLSLPVLVVSEKGKKETTTQTTQCVCMPEHPQQMFCRSDFVVRGKVIGRVGRSGGTDGNGRHIAPVDMESGMTAYIIRVERVYKGDEERGLERHAEIMMMRRDKACGLQRLNKGHVYIISGSHDETGQYHVGTCDWVTEYSDLTKMQKQGIRYLYRQYCRTCEISLCFSGNCKQRSASECLWDVSALRYNDDDCIAKHSRCIKFGNGKCGWYKSFGLKGCYRNRKLMHKNKVK